MYRLLAFISRKQAANTYKSGKGVSVILKKLLPLILIITLIAPYTSAFAAVYFTSFYSPDRDEYRFGYKPPDGTNMVRLTFNSPTGTYYESDFTVVNGIIYLTCNGTYNIKFYSGTTQLDETGNFVTTKIEQPSCQSYADGGAKDDYSVSKTQDADGNTVLSWNADPNASKYEVWKDGQKVAETTTTNYNAGKDGGGFTIIGKDSAGNTVGESDTNVDPSSGSGTDPTDPSCDACKWLTDQLACPAWDEYMGELTGAIKAALPPPPNWPSIADVFVDKFSNYFGDVPVPPSIPQIESNIRPPLPPINTSVPEASMEPIVPPAFNEGAIESDITSGQEIEVEDGSEPIEIYEPNKYIDSDEVGKFVYPNDERNTSNGIKQPDTIETDYAQPKPTNKTDYETPPADVPVPSGSGSSLPDSPMPVPEGSTGIIPIPQIGVGE